MNELAKPVSGQPSAIAVMRDAPVIPVIVLQERSDAVPLARALVAGGIRICPTGGITALNACAFLALPNVACVGGSWMTPPDAISSSDWDRITRLAREAVALR